MTIDLFLPFAKAILTFAIVFLCLTLAWLLTTDDSPADRGEDW